MLENNRKKIILLVLFVVLLATTSFVYAGTKNSNEADGSGQLSPTAYLLKLNKKTIKSGYTADAFSGYVRLSVGPNVMTQTSDIDIIRLDEKFIFPADFEVISPVYQFEIRNKKAFTGKKPLIVEMAYNKASNFYKQVYYYDKTKGEWKALPTTDLPDKKSVRVAVPFGFSRLVVLENPKLMSIGTASWYSHKNGLYAASPDFALGSILRVYNLANNKFVDVTVNDFGPDRKTHPDRVLDLDKPAFARLTALHGGVVKIKIEPIYIAPSSKVLGEKESKKESDEADDYRNNALGVTAKSAVLMNESTGEVLFAKNENKILPLASLTKVVAMKVFLDTKPNLDRVIAYSKDDEDLTYKYVEYKWEAARLKVADGETMTVRDMIYAALVGSANNSVETLVRVSGIPREEFMKNMNELVHSWGADSTTFVEPTGLSTENVSTAHDYAIITREAFKDPIIQKAASAPGYDFVTINLKNKHSLHNTDPLLTSKEYNITGSKTGFLYEAQHCLMVRAKTPAGKGMIAVTFAANSKYDSISDTKKLLNYGLKMIK